MIGIIYNVTVSVSSEVEAQWLKWMKEKHIPDVLGTGCFNGHKILRLSEGNQSPDPTYAIQYSCKNQSDLDRYREDFADGLQKEHSDLFQGKYAAFRTVLEVITD